MSHKKKKNDGYKTLIEILCCRKLQAEYDRLKKAHDRKGLSPLPSPPEMLPVSPQSARDAELIAEAKLLRQHKGRLEARMQILEDHNKQLESQLHRLRQLLEQVPTHLLTNSTTVLRTLRTGFLRTKDKYLLCIFGVCSCNWYQLIKLAAVSTL